MRILRATSPEPLPDFDTLIAGSEPLPPAPRSGGVRRRILAGGSAVLGGALILVAGIGAAGSLVPATETVADDRAQAAPVAEYPVGSAVVTAEAPGLAGLVDPNWLSTTARATGIPERALGAYAGAVISLESRTPGCGLGWNTLAAIGEVESEHGQIHGGRIDPDGVARPAIIGPALDGVRYARIADTDRGVLDGDTRWDRAVGPMQFIPETWSRWAADGSGSGTPDVHNIDDAALAAAGYLCAAGGDLTRPAQWRSAIAAYNADPAYAVRVSAVASRYGNSG